MSDQHLRNVMHEFGLNVFHDTNYPAIKKIAAAILSLRFHLAASDAARATVHGILAKGHFIQGGHWPDGRSDWWISCPVVASENMPSVDEYIASLALTTPLHTEKGNG